MSEALMPLIRAVHKLAVGGLNYRTDKAEYGVEEDWRSHAVKLLQDPLATYRDDCDGCAITAAELLLARGVAPKLIRIVLVDTRNRRNPDIIDHLVCAVGANGEDPWVIDNTQTQGPVKASDLKYTWGSGMRLSEPGVWRRTVV